MSGDPDYSEIVNFKGVLYRLKTLAEVIDPNAGALSMETRKSVAEDLIRIRQFLIKMPDLARRLET